MKNKMKTVLSFALAISLLFILCNFTTYATEDTDTPQGSIYGMLDVDFTPEIPDAQQISQNPVTIPSSYDPRIVNGVTDVKNQGDLGTCWAFGTIATLESSVYKYTGLKSSYSEEALRHVASSSFRDILNTTGYCAGYYKISANKGSHSIAALAYLTNRNNPITNGVSWVAPNNSLDIPYCSINTLDSNTLSLFNSSYVNCIPADVSYINFENVKQEIMEHGGVETSFCANPNYVNLDYGSFNNRVIDKFYTHSIEIIGWDDNFSKNNFNSNCIPQNDGAFLIKNSWGTSWGQGGFGWVSYEDVTLDFNRCSFVIDSVDKVSKNEYSLSYDYLPTVDETNIQLNSNENSVCMANVYDISDLADDYGTINKVTFYASNIGSFYKIYVVPLSGDDFTMPEMSQLGSIKAMGSVSNQGYITADFNTPYAFDQNTEKIAVIIKYTVDREETSNIKLAKESFLSYAYSPITYPNESFKYNNGIWTDISGGEICNIGNFCIRPVLRRRVEITQNSTVSCNNLTYTGADVTLDINLNGNQLYTVYESGGNTLYEDAQFSRPTANSITFKSSYLSNLELNQSKVIQLEFTDGDNQVITITRKQNLPDVSISGTTAVGKTLTATMNDTENHQGILFQWQCSENGTDWTDIETATNSTYVLTNNDLFKHLRVKILSSENSDYFYPSEMISPSPSTRVVLYGDANLDGYVNVKDPTYIKQQISKSASFDDEHLLAGDVNGDGIINIDDATLISNYCTQKITSFPVE